MKENKFESYFGRKIAVDASMSIYQFLVSSKSKKHMKVSICNHNTERG